MMSIIGKMGFFFLEYIKEILLNKNFDHTNINIYKNVNMSTSPVIYDLFLAFLSQILNLNNSKEIYELSHLLNFTIFFGFQSQISCPNSRPMLYLLISSSLS